MAGRESHSVGSAVFSPWSPKAVQALWILFTKEMRFSIRISEICSVDRIQIAGDGYGEERERESEGPDWCCVDCG